MEGYMRIVFILRPVTDISAMVAPVGVKFCMTVDVGRRQSPNQKFLA